MADAPNDVVCRAVKYQECLVARMNIIVNAFRRSRVTGALFLRTLDLKILRRPSISRDVRSNQLEADLCGTLANSRFSWLYGFIALALGQACSETSIVLNAARLRSGKPARASVLCEEEPTFAAYFLSLRKRYLRQSIPFP